MLYNKFYQAVAVPAMMGIGEMERKQKLYDTLLCVESTLSAHRTFPPAMQSRVHSGEAYRERAARRAAYRERAARRAAEDTATRLGIALTAAPQSSDLYRCWADRVQLADSRDARGDAAGCAEMVAEANRYASAA